MGSSDNAAALGCQEQRGYRRAAGALERHEGSVDSVAFSPDDTRIVSASGDKTLRPWQIRAARSYLYLSDLL